jgi:rhodanese-related sulfurtransferase
MKKLLIIILLFITTAYAEVVNQYISQDLINSGIKIIDIRTVGEWKEDGLVENSIPIEFFNEKGEYNVPLFMETLGTHVKQGEKFALICHTGSRTRIISQFLSKQFNMQVVNLRGGTAYAKAKGFKFYPYKGK